MAAAQLFWSYEGCPTIVCWSFAVEVHVNITKYRPFGNDAVVVNICKTFVFFILGF